MAQLGQFLGLNAKSFTQAGAVLPLREFVPLRTTADLGLPYIELAPIPYVYGRVSLSAIRLNSAGTEWLLADHAIAGIDLVRVNDAPTREFTLENTVDGVGHAIAKAILNDPQEVGAAVRVSVRGLLHPVTGELMTNAADILWHILHDIAGISIQLSSLEKFRSQTSKLGIEFGGVVGDPNKTLFVLMQELARAAGGVASAGIPGLAVLFPDPN